MEVKEEKATQALKYLSARKSQENIGGGGGGAGKLLPGSTQASSTEEEHLQGRPVRTPPADAKLHRMPRE